VREARAAFGEAIVNVVRFRNETTIHVQPAFFRDLCNFLRMHEQLAFVALSDVTAVDMLKLRTTPRFDVVAMLYSIQNRVRLRIKTGVNDGEPVPLASCALWPGADGSNAKRSICSASFSTVHPNLKRILQPTTGTRDFRCAMITLAWLDRNTRAITRAHGARTRTRWTGRGCNDEWQPPDPNGFLTQSI